MWHMYKPTKGVVNKLLGRNGGQLKPIMHTYNTAEIAEYGFQNIKANGGYKPYLLKVIRT